MTMNMTIKSFAFYTLGCKLNQAETAALSNEAQRRGFSIEHFQNGADVMVVNSCTLTNRADRKTRQAVFQARRRNPNAVIVLCGCLPQVQTDRENTLQAESDIVLGNRAKYSLFDALDQFMKF